MRSGEQCEVVDQFGPLRKRCTNRMNDVDHIVNRANWPEGRPGIHALSNLQAICKPHHDLKTWQESQEGKRKKKGGN